MKSDNLEDENHTSTNDENDNKMLKILKNISKIEEADGGNESDTPLYPKERKLSDCDRFNFDIFKLNTSACLQKDFERLHKEKRKQMKVRPVFKEERKWDKETKPLHNTATKQTGTLYLHGQKVKRNVMDDPFKNFDYFGPSSTTSIKEKTLL